MKSLKISPWTRYHAAFEGAVLLGLAGLSFACLGNEALLQGWGRTFVVPIFTAEASACVVIPAFAASNSSSNRGRFLRFATEGLGQTSILCAVIFWFYMIQISFGYRSTVDRVAAVIFLAVLFLRGYSILLHGKYPNPTRAYGLTLGPLAIAAVITALIFVLFDNTLGKAQGVMLFATFFFGVSGLLCLFVKESRL